jgi:hypoxanthine phosphoribosyltransferase
MWIIAVTALTTGVTLIAGGIAIYDAYLARTVHKAEPGDFPIRIRRSISYGHVYEAFRKLQHRLDADRFAPEVVVGIHYEGTSYGAILAKQLYRPIVTARVTYDHRGSDQHLEDIEFMCDKAEWLAGKKVLIVDNSIKSGETLEAVSRFVGEYAKGVRTLVVYRDDSKAKARFTPDYILFCSKKHLRLVK